MVMVFVITPNVDVECDKNGILLCYIEQKTFIETTIMPYVQIYFGLPVLGAGRSHDKL